MTVPVFDNAKSFGAASTTFLLGGGSNRLVVVGAATEGNNVTNVTFDGVAMTFSTLATGFESRVELWYMLEADLPVGGTYSIVVTGGGGENTHGVASYTNVDQITFFGTIVTASGSSSPITVAVASAVDELVHDFVVEKDGSSLAVGAGQTQRWNLVGQPGDVEGGGSTEPGAASVTMSWTVSGTVGWATIGVPLKGVAGGTPPTVDAGGPYNGDVDVATALNATVTPGTDPTPVLLWTIFSGPGGGVFSNDAIEDPTFTPDTVGSYVLQLSADPSDGPPVLDTATFESDDVPPVVDAGGPYNGDVSAATPLDATVTPGSDPTPVLLWTIDSGPGGGVFSNDAIEDPTFTPDTVGSYVLRLTATPSDGPAVFDTATFESDPVIVAPTVDAGGPYNGPSGQATALDATVTPGTDPTPVLLWTIDSGGAGVFSNDAIEDPTFTPTFPTVGPYVLRLTVTPSDGPAVFDTANFESDPVAPTVDAGGPYAGDVATPIALNGTVTPGTDPAPTLLWTIDSGGTGTFSDDTIEDPDFTADAIGAYVLRLTVTPSDGPDVFDTAALTTAALADAVFLGGRLLRGGTGDLVMSQLALGADPNPADLVFIKGTAHSQAGAMYVALDDGVVSRVFIAGIAHQQNGVRLITFNPPIVSLNAWGLDANGAQGVATSGAGQPHEGVLLRGDGQTVVDGVTPPPIGPPALAELIHWYDFDDLSTLWQDIAGTIPVTTPGQSLPRVDDKGTFGTDLTDESAGQFRTPMWGFSNGTGEYDSPVGGFNKVLSSQVSPGISGSELTMAWVADRDDGDTGTANVATWMSVQGIQLDQFSGNNLQGFTNGIGVNGLFVTRALLGAMFIHRFPSAMELRDSQHSGFLSAVNAVFTNPIANQDLSVGAESAGSGAEWRGIIKAVFIWNKALTTQEIQDFKDFTTAKFGLAWA